MTLNTAASSLSLYAVQVYLVLRTAGYILTGGEILSGYLDEILILFLSLVSFYQIIVRNVIAKDAFFVLFAAFILVFFGIFGAVRNEDLSSYPALEASFVAVVIDIKFFLAAASIITVLYFEPPDKIKSWIASICEILVLIGILNAALMVRDMVSGSGLHGATLHSRSGFSIALGIYDHKFKTAFLCLISYIASLHLRKKKTSILLFIFLVLTLSVKEIASGALVTFIFIRANYSVTKVAILSSVWMSSIVVILFTQNPISDAIYNRFSTFLFNSDYETVRGELYVEAPVVATDYFPFGSGAGSYGSSPSRDIYYSPLYYKYGIAYIYGGSEEFGSFLVDTFWPKILGEYGWFGLALYLWMFSKIVRFRDISVFPSGVTVACFVVSFATPVYNYADGSIFAGMAAGLVLVERKKIKSRQRTTSNISENSKYIPIT